MSEPTLLGLSEYELALIDRCQLPEPLNASMARELSMIKRLIESRRLDVSKRVEAVSTVMDDVGADEATAKLAEWNESVDAILAAITEALTRKEEADEGVDGT